MLDPNAVGKLVQPLFGLGLGLEPTRVNARDKVRTRAGARTRARASTRARIRVRDGGRREGYLIVAGSVSGSGLLAGLAPDDCWHGRGNTSYTSSMPMTRQGQGRVTLSIGWATLTLTLSLTLTPMLNLTLTLTPALPLYP